MEGTRETKKVLEDGECSSEEDESTLKEPHEGQMKRKQDCNDENYLFTVDSVTWPPGLW